MYGIVDRMLKTTVYLPRSLKDRLERMASDRGVSEAALIRAAVEHLITATPPPPTLPLFDSLKPIEDWDEAMRGFGED